MHSEPTATGALLVDLDALARNFRAVRAAAASAECAAVVKANAYGLGVAPVTRRLLREGCRSFFVATLAEGRELRTLAPEAAIYVFEGVLDGRVADLVENALTPVLNSLAQVERWAKEAPHRAAALHVDTGISRLGMTALEVAALAARVQLLERLDVRYVLTHFACADEPEHRLNDEQLRRFDALRAQLPPCRTSIGNSAAIFGDERHRGDLVRPGIALYGGNPFSDRPNPLEAVVTLKARILQIRDVDEALTVGYGATYGAVPPARLAVVGVGYCGRLSARAEQRRHGCRAGHACAGGRAGLDGLDLHRRVRAARKRGTYRGLGGAHRPDGDARRGGGGRRHDQLRNIDETGAAVAP